MRRGGLIGDPAWPVWSVTRGRTGWRRVRGLAVLTAFMVWPSYGMLHGGASPLVLALAAGYGVSWIAVMAYGIGRSPGERTAMVAGLFVLGGLLMAVHGDPAAGGFLAYALTAAAWLLPARWTLAVALAALLAELAVLWLTRGPAMGWDGVLGAVSSTVTPAMVVLLVRLLVQLSRAREEIETLATAAERARLARDLHDVLGHSLTTITAKTGLARRMLESGGDHDPIPAALAELRDVERLSREAHAEIRATVSGYRRPSLAVELGGVRAALRAAGITATLPAAVDHVVADLREPFAYVLREGITNVIRHSGATRCEVRLGPSSLEIRDNGPGSGAARPPGNGLAGLEERLRVVHGRLQAGPLDQGGFLLRATRP